MMEGSDGWRVIEQLKTEAATNAIPVVMVTILDRKDKGFALGAADYFTKPIDWERMFRVLV
jgi:PleD family two-component response regulator